MLKRGHRTLARLEDIAVVVEAQPPSGGFYGGALSLGIGLGLTMIRSFSNSIGADADYSADYSNDYSV